MAEPAEGNQGATILGVEKSVGGRHWRSRASDENRVEQFRSAHDIPEILARVLAGRDVEVADLASFFAPTLKAGLPDPSLIKDMDVAVDRLVRAIAADESIIVFGDYDVDGATSSALIKRYLDDIGVAAEVYIPDRMTEGYGPSTAAFQRFAEDKTGLVITLDCGTLAFDPIEAAASGGTDVVVIDHHQPSDTLPCAVAVINPNRADDTSKTNILSAGGLTFMFLVALNRRLRQDGYFEKSTRPEPDLRKCLDLVALSTVCDVMPLQGLNRTFVHQGLRVLGQTENLGLQALRQAAGAKGAPSAYDLGFILGPRINAGGRVGQSHLGSRLLSTRDPREAAALAASLHELNEKRRALEREVVAGALDLAEVRLGQSPGTRVLVLWQKDWHPGIVGIVASRIVDRFHLPALVIGIDDAGVGKGSGRSVPGLDLGALIAGARQRNMLEAGGGHAMAVGVTIREEALPAFSDFLNDAAAVQPASEAAPRLGVDGVLRPGAISRTVFNDIQRAAPFGEGNPEPRFALERMTIAFADEVGDGHVRCTLKDEHGEASVSSIAFRVGGSPVGETLLKRQLPVHVAGKMRRDDWRGGNAMQFQIDDVAVAE